MLILGIETSCDECACAVVDDSGNVLSNKIATQIARHKPFYGVVPELASRLHTELIQVVVEEAIAEANIKKSDIDAVAVTSTPGLIGSLLVGVNFAKTFSYFLKKPLISVNHIYAHLYAAKIQYQISYPYIGVLVSGGHSLIAKVNNYDVIEILGASADDAIGEAFDKVAKYYDMGFPGGVAIDELSKKGDMSAFNFPLAHLDKKRYSDLDMSFSGLKSAVINNRLKYLRDGFEDNKENLAASFQKTAVKIIIDRIKKAIKNTGIKNIVLGGGVAANSHLRSEALKLGSSDVKVYIPPILFCTDNAVMVAGIGVEYYKDKIFSDYYLSAQSRISQYKSFNKSHVL